MRYSSSKAAVASGYGGSSGGSSGGYGGYSSRSHAQTPSKPSGGGWAEASAPSTPARTKQDGTPDGRYRENRPAVGADGIHRNTDGSVDRRFDTSSRAGTASTSQRTKQDGTPDGRYRENRPAVGGDGIHRNTDGSVDRRFGTSSRAGTASTSQHTKQDGTPDGRYRANRPGVGADGIRRNMDGSVDKRFKQPGRARGPEPGRWVPNPGFCLDPMFDCPPPGYVDAQRPYAVPPPPITTCAIVSSSVLDQVVANVKEYIQQCCAVDDNVMDYEYAQTGPGSVAEIDREIASLLAAGGGQLSNAVVSRRARLQLRKIFDLDVPDWLKIAFRDQYAQLLDERGEQII